MNNENLAKLIAEKYSRDAGEWCRIYYTASMAECLSDHKTHVKVLKEE